MREVPPIIVPSGTTSVRNSFLTDEQRAQLMIAASQGLSGRSCHKHERMKLAEKIGVHEGTVKNWLNNQRRKRKSSFSGTPPQQQTRRKIKHEHSNQSSPLSAATSDEDDTMEPISLSHRIKLEPLDDENNNNNNIIISSTNSSIPSTHTSPHARYTTIPHHFNHMIDILSHIDTLLSTVGNQWSKHQHMNAQLQALFAFHQHILTYTLPTTAVTQVKEQQQQQQQPQPQHQAEHDQRPPQHTQPQQPTQDQQSQEPSIAQSRPARLIHPPSRFNDSLRMDTMKRAVTAPLPMSAPVTSHEKSLLDIFLPTESVVRHDMVITPNVTSTSASTSSDALFCITSPTNSTITSYTHDVMETSSTISSMSFDTTSTITSFPTPSTDSSHDINHPTTSCTDSSHDIITDISHIHERISLLRPISLPRQTSLEFLNNTHHLMGLHGDETLF